MTDFLGPPDDISHDIELLNLVASEELQNQAAVLRERFIAFTLRAAGILRLHDIHAMNEATKKGTEIVLYTLVDYFSASQDMDRIVPTISMRMESSVIEAETIVSLERTQEKLQLYVPVPEETDADDDVDIRHLPVPDKVFVSRTERDGSERHYIVSIAGLYRYQNVQRTETGIVGPDTVDLQLWQMMHKRVDTGLPVVGALFEYLVNMKVVPQRRLIVGRAEVEDV